jgi:hypothetical protein
MKYETKNLYYIKAYNFEDEIKIKKLIYNNSFITELNKQFDIVTLYDFFIYNIKAFKKINNIEIKKYSRITKDVIYIPFVKMYMQDKFELIEIDLLYTLIENTINENDYIKVKYLYANKDNIYKIKSFMKNKYNMETIIEKFL